MSHNIQSSCMLITLLYIIFIQSTSSGVFVFSVLQLPQIHLFRNSNAERESDRRMATEHIVHTADEYNVELLPSDHDAPPLESSWRLSLDAFQLPSSPSSTGRHDGCTRFSRYFRTPSKIPSSCFRDLCSIHFGVNCV